ncbi:MAG TPA: VWA domain-containing protein [Bryobacteraceae bacterium]|nr:VWA domain-containing protein [Bryobacteraceae bacterium]
MVAKNSSKKSQSGQAIVLFTMMVASVMVPITGLAIDGGRAYLVRLKLSSAVDGGALAAARLLGTGANANTQLSNAQQTAIEFVKANFPTGFFGANLATGSPNVCVDPGTDNSDPCHVGNGGTVQTYKVRTVSVTASAVMPALFMGIFGLPNVSVASSGLASRRDVRVVVVIDRSSSMSGYFGTGANSIIPMAQSFVNGFSGSGDLGGRDQVGLVVFGGSGIVAYPPRDITKDYTDYTQFTAPDNNFKLASNIPKYLADVADGSNTGTAEALYLAYMTLRADAATNTDLSTKLNVIVLFTDGIPNGITAFADDPDLTAKYNKNFMLASTSNCPDLGSGTWAGTPVTTTAKNLIGWFSQWGGNVSGDTTHAPHGLFTSMMAFPYSGSYTGKGDDIDAYMKNAGQDNTVIPHWSDTDGLGHKCNTAQPMTSATISKFPDYDLFGNYTDLSKVPAVAGITPPTGPGGTPLYKLGSLWSTSTQCNKAIFDATKPTDACQVGLASWQAAAHQAWKIWNQIVWDKTTRTNIQDPAANLSQPVIFTIGFAHKADDMPDMTLLQMIANDPAAPVAFSSRINGQAFLAADPNAVGAAFQQIASEILRLSK